jgi:cyclase
MSSNHRPHLRPRVIPCLLLRNTGLVKTIKFKDPTYLGDPRNVVKIFNDKDADELVLLDITATLENRGPRFEIIEEIASECFMPMGYGGGITNSDQVKRVVSIGIEKVVINSAAVQRPQLITESAQIVGSQSVVVSIDVKKVGLISSRYEVFTHGGRKATGLHPVDFAKSVEQAGAGEIIVNSIDQDGSMKGYDIALIRQVADAVNIPVVACGGAGSVADLVSAVKQGGASAVAAGSFFVFQGKHRAVLISFPTGEELQRGFSAS